MSQLETDERRTIEEVLALYDLEPSLKDIYVEGWRDKCFFEWFLKACDIVDVSVYDIETIDIRNNILAQYGLQANSQRSRVIALSKKLDSGLCGRTGIMCIVDRDYDDYVSSSSGGSYLKITDYNSLELYALDNRIITKFFKIVIGCDFVKDTVDTILKICENLYLFRLANIRLGWNMSWINATRVMKIKQAKIVFDDETFIERYLQNNRKWSKKTEYITEVQKLKSIVSNEVRNKIRGHDFTEIFFTFIRRTRQKRKFGNLETFEGSLLACIEKEYLMEHNLFKSITTL